MSDSNHTTSAASTSSVNPLFTPILLNSKVTLDHRVVLSPLTRFRSTKKAHVPILDLVANYYSQRASAKGTLLITEATLIHPKAGGYDNVPGIWSEDQVAAWKQVTDGVHAKGSFIYSQLWALGRTASPQVLEEDGYDFVSASDVPIVPGATSPRPLTKEEIKEYLQMYAQAAENAIRAGFDGVEIHGANGYLPDQFIQDVTNHRTDEYGGSVENRSRFALEIVDAVSAKIGEDKVGIRFSPWSDYQGMKMADPVPQFSDILTRLAASHPSLSYVHFIDARTDPNSPVHETLDFARDIWRPTGRPFLTAGGFTPELALEHFKQPGRENELAVFGRWFLANPDLVRRIQDSLPLNPYDRDTFYTPETAKGYIDYPFFEDASIPVAA